MMKGKVTVFIVPQVPAKETAILRVFVNHSEYGF